MGNCSCRPMKAFGSSPTDAGAVSAVLRDSRRIQSVASFRIVKGPFGSDYGEPGWLGGWGEMNGSPGQPSEGLSGEHIWGITRDPHGDLWVTTNNGVNQLRGVRIRPEMHGARGPRRTDWAVTRPGRLRLVPTARSGSGVHRAEYRESIHAPDKFAGTTCQASQVATEFGTSRSIAREPCGYALAAVCFC